MATTYLTRTSWGTATNKQKFTQSFWVKRGVIGVEQVLLGVESGGSNEARVLFKADDTFEFYDYQSAYKFRKITNRKFRDCSAWYNIVLAVDTTHPTGSARVNIYINGVQETSFSTSTDPAQNLNTFYNSSGNHIVQIGRQSTGGSYFTGSMSHVNFCDGTTLAPTVFGSTDATTGEWEGNTSPSVTYGTNGYFILKDGNNVTDQSGRGNNFTVGGGTLINLKDNPDNVFATLNPLMPLGSNIAYSNGNLTITPGTSDYKTTASTIAVSSGKFYTEFKAVSGHNGSTDVSIGIVGADTFLASTGSKAMSAYTDSFSYGSGGLVKKYNGATIRTDATYTNGDIIGIAVDMDNLKLYWSKNGTFQNSGNPASGSTGTGAVLIPSGQPYYICATTISSGGVKVFSANFGNGFFGTTAVTTNSGNGYAGAEGASKFNYAVPSGYSALSTKGLNL